VVVVTTAPPPPVEGVVVVGVLQSVLFKLQPVVPLFLGSTPTARRAGANTPTAPRMILRRRLVARSPVSGSNDGPASLADELAKLKALHESAALSDEEFDSAKDKLLG